jgi:hypothetical protein
MRSDYGRWLQAKPQAWLTDLTLPSWGSTFEDGTDPLLNVTTSVGAQAENLVRRLEGGFSPRNRIGESGRFGSPRATELRVGEGSNKDIAAARGKRWVRSARCGLMVHLQTIRRT